MPAQRGLMASITRKIKETHERQGGLAVAGRDAAHLLEPVEHSLDARTILVTPPFCFVRSAETPT